MELNNNQTFTKFPNELLEHIMCSKLNASEIKILLCVVRYTYGFHREQHQLSVSFIQKATDLSYNNVQKAVQHLIEKSILIETKKYTPTTPRCIAINPDFNSVFQQNYNGIRSNTPIDIVASVIPTQNIVMSLKETQNDTQTDIQSYGGIYSNTSTGIELIPTPSIQSNTSRRIATDTQEINIKIKGLKKEFKENSRVDTSVNGGDKKPFNMNILKTQIAQQYLSVSTEDDTYPFTLEEVVDIFVFYYEEYKKYMNTDHPILNDKNIKRIIRELPLCDDTSGNGYIELFPDLYPDMIKKHFKTKYQNCDYNILHFISGLIRALRYHETIYE